MKCTTCGYENPDGAKVCMACNTYLAPQAASEEQQFASAEAPAAAATKKFDVEEKIRPYIDLVEKNLKKILILLGAVVALALILTIGKAIFTGPGYDETKATILAIDNAKDGLVQFTYNDKLLDGDIEADSYSSKSSLDGTVKIVKATVSEDVKQNEGEGEGEELPLPQVARKSTLYVVTKKGIETVADDVYGYALSMNGKVIAYTDKDADLYLYTVGNGKSEKIAGDVLSSSIVLSPNGKKAAYVEEKVKESEEGTTVDYTMYVYNGKETVKIGDDFTPVALSDSAKFIYYVKSEENGNGLSLYVTNLKGDKTKISADVGYQFIFNEDVSEIIFSSNGKAYASKKGKDKIKISNDVLVFPALPEKAASFSYSNNSTYASIFSVKSLADRVACTSGGDFIRLNKKFEATTLVKGADEAAVSDNLKSAYYTKNEKLFYVDLTKKNPEPKVLADDVYSLYGVPGKKAVYFLDDSDTLWFVKGKGKAKRIADDVYDIEVSHDGYAFFIDEYKDGEGTLCVSKNGSKRKKIADDVSVIYAYSKVTTYHSDNNAEKGTYTVNIAKSGKKFKKIAEDVSPINMYW